MIYYWYQGQVMYPLMAYPKNKKDDLSADELRVLSAVVEEEKATWKRSSLET